MKLRMPLFILIIVGMFLFALATSAHAFNLLADLDTNIKWDLGSAASGGTSVLLRHEDAVNAKAGQFVGSALAEVVDYRFLSLWGGGTFIPQPDGSLRALDTGKLGLNLGYFLKNMVNQPPAIFNNLVFGPGLATSIVSTPHVIIPTVDVNYKFGS